MNCWCKAFILAFSFCFCNPIYSQYTIKGKIVINNEWDPVIYLSAINSLDDFKTASLQFLVNSAEIKPDGRFTLEGDNLPLEPRIYRVHIVKRDDPVNTIVIGGKEEYHIHFIMDNDSEIYIEPDPTKLFSLASIKGYQENVMWNRLNTQVIDKYDIFNSSSLTARTYNQNTLLEKLKSFADTCNYDLVSLIALNRALEYENFETTVNLNFYAQIINKIEQANPSPYSKEIKNKLDFLHFNANGKSQNMGNKYWYSILTVLFIFVVGLFLWKSNRFKVWKDNVETNFDQLSIRERKVFALLKQGKSNKDISNELHIELSTVKSHVSSIYAKLGINSRKEIYNNRS